MALQEIRLIGTTDGSGDLTVTATKAVTGRLIMVEWVDGAAVNGVDGVLSDTERPSGVDAVLLTLTDANVDKLYYTRVTPSGVTGTDLAALTILEPHVVLGKLELVVAQGGATKAGVGCICYIEEK